MPSAPWGHLSSAEGSYILMKFLINYMPESISDTILHEIAHALTQGAGHGPRWKRKCIEIGAKSEQYGPLIVRPKSVYNFTLECTQCDNWWGRWKKPASQGRQCRCGGSLKTFAKGVEVSAKAFKWALQCPNCFKQSKFYRKPKANKACGKCCNMHNGGRYAARFKLNLVKLS